MVPRTFAGAFVLSYVAKLITLVVPNKSNTPINPMLVQFLIRAILLFLSWMAHVRLAAAVDDYFKRRLQLLQSPTQKESSTNQPPTSEREMRSKAVQPTITTISSYYLLITASQFHIPFYSSRLLPNTFALLLVTHAYAEWFLNRPRRTAMFLVFTTAIFRCDVLLLLFTAGLSLLIRRQLTIIQAILTGIVTGIVSLILTVPLDSLLWGRVIWPEFSVWWFNTIDNRSGEWGKMVWHWYFSKALPKGMLLTALLVPFAFLRLPEKVDGWARRSYGQHMQKCSVSQRGLLDLALLPFFAPVIGFIALYSFLPHKEIRFIFPALPMFNVCAAHGMSRLHCAAFLVGDEQKIKNCEDRTNQEEGNAKHFKSYWLNKGMWLCGIGAIALTMIGSVIFLRLSMENYPGGEALNRLRRHLDASVVSSANKQQRSPKWEDVHVHVDVAAAMTGVSLFGQRYAAQRYLDESPFRIEKSGYEEENQVSGIYEFTNRFTHLLTEEQFVDGYHMIDVVQGYPRLDFRNFGIATRNATYLLEKDGWLGLRPPT